MIPKSVNRFSEKIMLNQKLERNFDSIQGDRVPGERAILVTRGLSARIALTVGYRPQRRRLAARLQQVVDVLARHRLGEEVALQLVAAGESEHDALLFGFDAFGTDL